jgi:hypothetical protein
MVYQLVPRSKHTLSVIETIQLMVYQLVFHLYFTVMKYRSKLLHLTTCWFQVFFHLTYILSLVLDDGFQVETCSRIYN